MRHRKDGRANEQAPDGRSCGERTTAPGTTNAGFGHEVRSMQVHRLVSVHSSPLARPRAVDRVWRIATLVAIVANVTIQYAADQLPLGTRSMRAISRAHAGFFAPAEFTQAIWGLIFGTLLVYGAAQALPRHARSPTLDRLAKPMFLANFLMAAWTVAFKSELAASAFLLVTAVWMLAVAMLTEVHGGMQKERGARAWHIPISLLAGWLTVTLLSSMGTALVDSGWIRGSTALVPITVVMIGYAALVATLFSAEFVDPIVPLVVAWGMAGLYVAQLASAPLVALAAFVVGAGLAVWGCLILVFRATRNAPSLFGERRSPRNVDRGISASGRAYRSPQGH